MICKYCKKTFVLKSIRHPKQRFCSNKCCQYNWVKNNKDKLRILEKRYRDKNKIKLKKYRKKNKEKAKDYKKIYYSKIENKEHKVKNDREYYQKNKERLKKQASNWFQENKDKRSKYLLNKLRTDKNFRIAWRLRSRVRRTIMLYLKTKQVLARKYGIDYSAIVEHLKPFPKDLNEYHIDHIKPLCSFDLTNPKQLQLAFAPENHQWLKAEENWKKGRSLNWQ